MVQRRLVGFVAGLAAFLIIQRQAAMLGDKTDVFVVGQFVGAGGQGSEGRES